MRKAVVFLAGVAAGFFGLTAHPQFAFAQGVPDMMEGRFSLEKTSVADLDEAAPARQNMRPHKEVKYVAGKDDLWFTPDDEIFHYYLAEYNGHTGMIKKTCYKVGKDMIPFNEDDEVQEYQTYEFGTGAFQDQAIKEFSFNAAGPDGIWFTGDDAQKSYSVYEFNSSGEKIKDVRYNIENQVVHYTTFAYTPQGLLAHDAEYKGPGKDGAWFSADDELEKYHTRERDASGKLVRAREYHAEYNGQGADGVWFTKDDVVFATRALIYSKAGLVSGTRKFTGPGPDTQWFTQDDLMQYYTVRYFVPVIHQKHTQK